MAFKGNGILKKRGRERFGVLHQEARLRWSHGTAKDFPLLFAYGV